MSLERQPSAVVNMAVRIARALESVGMVAAVVVLLGLAALVVGPKLVGMQGIVVLSGSMEPDLQTGGVVFVKPVADPSTLEVGNIITFTVLQSRNVQVTHRIIEVVQGADGLAFRTQGDANDTPDSDLVLAESVRGKVQGTLPYAGYVIDELHKKTTYYLIVGIPAALLILSELANIGKEMRRPTPQPEDEGTN